MFDIKKPPKKGGGPKKRAKSALNYEDVAENNPKLAAFIKERQERRKRVDDFRDSDFWVCLVFQSVEQKKEFLKQLSGVPSLYDGTYVDGQTLAEAIGKPVTPNEITPHVTCVQKKLAELVLEEERERARELRKTMGGGFG